MTTPREELQKLIDEERFNRNPSFPKQYYPKPNKSNSPANQLTREIIKHITLIGGWATRVNTMGRLLNGKYIPGSTKLGTPDVIACINGKFVGIEIKIGKDVQSEAQKLIESDINKAGGGYVLCNSIDKWFEFYSEWLT